MKDKELKGMSLIVLSVFIAFLLIPLAILLSKSFETDAGFALTNYSIILDTRFTKALTNSLTISAITAISTTTLAFLLSYSVNYTNIPMQF